MSNTQQVVIVGGGIVGLATAWALARVEDPAAIVLLEKEASFASHQSGRNSGVIHSGIYYRPGSRKARLCRQGRAQLTEFCRREGLALRRVGKLIIAVEEGDSQRLRMLHERGLANGVESQLLNRGELRALEPRARGIEGLAIAETAIVDFRDVALRLAEKLEAKGVRLLNGVRVEGIEEEAGTVRLATSAGPIRADFLANCAGLYAVELARAIIPDLSVRIVPFRGEYYSLATEAAEGLSGRCLYPVPLPGLPFLGVHLTPTMQGSILAGPNAVLALASEGYQWRQVSARDLWRIASYPGFWRLAARYWQVGLAEMVRSLSRARFAASLRRLVSGVEAMDLRPWPAGVRAQAVTRQGALADDFLFEETERTLHVLNAPSPAATAALRIGEEIAGRLRGQMAGR